MMQHVLFFQLLKMYTPWNTNQCALKMDGWKMKHPFKMVSF